MRQLKKIAPLLFCVCFIFTVGCATSGDLRRTQGALEGKILALKEENAGLRKDVDKLNEALAALQKSQAEARADITEIRDGMQNLKGIAEASKKDVSAFTARAGLDKEKLENLSFKINYVENFLGISMKDNHLEGDKTKTASKNGQKGKLDKESAYASAYESFKEGKYEKARTEFQSFLRFYPNSEYSDNAQFWVGESYYFENKYEKAILEYEKVVKNYPNGNKVPYALLKQGLSFLNLGDKASARVILQQIIKKYPNTNQSRIARAKLVEIK